MIYLEFIFTSLLAIGLAVIINPHHVFEAITISMLALIYYTVLKIENKK